MRTMSVYEGTKGMLQKFQNNIFERVNQLLKDRDGKKMLIKINKKLNQIFQKKLEQELFLKHVMRGLRAGGLNHEFRYYPTKSCGT